MLPVGVAAGIAAGETIERPASVVKELVENALDAGATAIRIDVRGGGLDLIRVGDDGRGIRAADLWLACQRHATSKYPAEGLGAVRTLGFRGEALPSIAGVAELDLVSATGTGAGWRLTLRGGRVLRDEPAPRPAGTTVTVRGLFADLPARRSTFTGTGVRGETTQIAATVRRLALAAPGVRFSLHVEDRLALQTSGSGDLLSTLAETHGHALSGSLVALGPVEAAGATIHGAIAGAEVTRPGRGGVTLLVNGRPVYGRGLQSALEAAYRPLLPRGRHPVLLLAIEVDPRRVDVNVHPAKLEVRLRDEREIAAAMAGLVRDALGRRPLRLRWEPLAGAAALARDAETALAETPRLWDDASPIVTPGLPPLRLIGQVGARLLLLEGDAGLYLVDQHRAHERILYERMRAAHATGDGEVRPRNRWRCPNRCWSRSAFLRPRRWGGDSANWARSGSRWRSSAGAPSCSAPRPACRESCREATTRWLWPISPTRPCWPRRWRSLPMRPIAPATARPGRSGCWCGSPAARRCAAAASSTGRRCGHW